MSAYNNIPAGSLYDGQAPWNPGPQYDEHDDRPTPNDCRFKGCTNRTRHSSEVCREHRCIHCDNMQLPDREECKECLIAELIDQIADLTSGTMNEQMVDDFNAKMAELERIRGMA